MPDAMACSFVRTPCGINLYRDNLYFWANSNQAAGQDICSAGSRDLVLLRKGDPM